MPREARVETATLFRELLTRQGEMIEHIMSNELAYVPEAMGESLVNLLHASNRLTADFIATKPEIITGEAYQAYAVAVSRLIRRLGEEEALEERIPRADD